MNMLPKNPFARRQQKQAQGRTATPVRPRPQRGGFNLRGRMALVCGGLGLCSLALIGRAVEVPPALADLLSRPAQADPIPADYDALRERVLP